MASAAAANSRPWRPLEELSWDDSFVRELPGDPRYDAIPARCCTLVTPRCHPRHPKLVAWSQSVADILDLDHKFERPDFPQLFSGASPLVGSSPSDEQLPAVHLTAFLLALARSHDPRHIDLVAAGMVRFLTVVGARMEWIRASTLSKFSGSIYPGTFRKKMIRSNLAEVTQHKYCWEESRETGQTGVSLSARARPQCIYDPVAEVEMTPLAGVVCT